MNDMTEGVVTKATGSNYTVRFAGGQEVVCRVRGRIRLRGARSTSPVVVGDRVNVEMSDGEGWITGIRQRENYIIRRASNLSKESHIIAANISQALLIASLRTPQTSYEFIDRFLVTAEAYHIPVVIVLNKYDLYGGDMADEVAMFHATYEAAGYEVIDTSAATGLNINLLKERLHDRVTLLSGNSGVGKSSVIRAIDPSLDIRTGSVSDAHGKGRHTTTFSEMFPLKGGGYVIDSPGIKGFGLIDIGNDEIGRYFPEIFALSRGCQYNNCTHTHEPNCAVRNAAEEGALSGTRYTSYLKLLEDDTKYRK